MIAENPNDIYPLFYWKSHEGDLEFLGSGIKETASKKDDLNVYLPIPYEGIYTYSPKIQETSLKEIESFLNIHSPLSNTCPTLREVTLTPDKEEWRKIFNISLEKITTNHLKKIVLARKKILTYQSPVSPQDILNHLRKSSTSTYGHLYFFQQNQNEAFIGLSPERILKIKNGHFYTEAIAGTRPRGKNDQEDLYLENDLRNSPKEIIEQELVANHIRTCLRSMNEEFHESERSILKLSHLQHLRTSFSMMIPSHLSLDSIINTIHPTPALVGFPRGEAQSFLDKYESFDRMAYGRPIGIYSPDLSSVDIAASIRSIMIKGNEVHIFAGAGIVEESEFEREWDETSWKLESIQQMMGL